MILPEPRIGNLVNQKTFSNGFRYGLGLWAARLLLTIIAIPPAACLLALLTVILENLFRALGWIA